MSKLLNNFLVPVALFFIFYVSIDCGDHVYHLFVGGMIRYGFLRVSIRFPYFSLVKCCFVSLSWTMIQKFYYFFLNFFLYYLEKIWYEVKLFSHVQLFATPWIVAYQAPLSMELSRQEYWSGLPFPSPGDPPDPGLEPRSPAVQADAPLFEHQGSPTRV